MTYAVVTHHNDLLNALRRRIAELDLSCETVEALSGIQSGYASKVLSDPPAKRLGPFVMFCLVEALGLRVHLVEDIELIEKLRPRYVKRKITRPKPAVAGTIEIPRDLLVLRARAGGRARMAKMSPQQRSGHQRRAALARWRREVA